MYRCLACFVGMNASHVQQVHIVIFLALGLVNCVMQDTLTIILVSHLVMLNVQQDDIPKLELLRALNAPLEK